LVMVHVASLGEGNADGEESEDNFHHFWIELSWLGWLMLSLLDFEWEWIDDFELKNRRLFIVLLEKFASFRPTCKVLSFISAYFEVSFTP
jgi:hypothetical protein